MFELVNWLNISMTIFDAWGNREYKTYLTEQEEFNQENDFFKYVRPVGWKYHDFYLDSCRRFGLRQDEGIKAEKG
jgi:hypothetical protein